MFVKLFREILMSSIWDEDADTRLLWITMLVLADQDGYVRGTPSAIARTARLNVDAAQKALDVLAAPDPQSRTPDNDGRRIEPAPGGWMVLNYQAYREARSAEERRTYMRNYMRDYRARKHPVNKSLATLAQADVEAEEERTSPEPAETPPLLAGLALYADDSRLIKQWPELYEALKQANPGVNVDAEVVKAHAWEVANPTKRKRNRGRFLHSWCARSQDQQGGRRKAESVEDTLDRVNREYLR